MDNNSNNNSNGSNIITYKSYLSPFCGISFIDNDIYTRYENMSKLQIIDITNEPFYSNISIEIRKILLALLSQSQTNQKKKRIIYKLQDYLIYSKMQQLLAPQKKFALFIDNYLTIERRRVYQVLEECETAMNIINNNNIIVNEALTTRDFNTIVAIIHEFEDINENNNNNITLQESIESIQSAQTLINSSNILLNQVESLIIALKHAFYMNLNNLDLRNTFFTLIYKLERIQKQLVCVFYIFIAFIIAIQIC